MKKEIKAIQFDEDGFINIIRNFGGHGMRSDKMVLFIDEIIDIKEAMLCSNIANKEYLAIEINEKNYPLIDELIKAYTRLNGGINESKS